MCCQVTAVFPNLAASGNLGKILAEAEFGKTAVNTRWAKCNEMSAGKRKLYKRKFKKK